MLHEIFRIKMRESSYENADALQADPDTWLRQYNTERPHRRYRNRGRRPIKTISPFVSQEGQRTV